MSAPLALGYGLDMAMPSDAIELIPLREIARRHIEQVLEACHGNRTDAARVLGVDRKTLYRKLLKYSAPS